ncbi:hypothetical protein D1P53_000255 [Cryptococcus gattii VGV]|nr:hypothetical protein D1P53_000255 [Cryptococcus gattii VGV]
MAPALARPLRSLNPAARHLARCASTATPQSSSAPPPPSDPQSSQHTPLPRPAFSVPYTPVPRLPGFPNSFKSPSHKHYNYPTPLFNSPPTEKMPDTLAEQSQAKKETKLAAVSGLSREELRNLCRFTVRSTKVQHMTKKGKMASQQAYVVVGHPEKGLVGLGRGRGHSHAAAQDDGFQKGKLPPFTNVWTLTNIINLDKAVLNMDYVNRYEERTLWGEGKDLRGKWGAAKSFVKGFGLMVPPMIHRVFTACGIKDASAMIVGSRNRPDVLKATIQVLHGGGNPSGFGTGIFGKKGPRENKGRGMRSKDEIERERGRYGVDVGRRI